MSEVRVLGAVRTSPRQRQPRRRSRLIDVLRILLPALALILVGLVIAWPQIMPGPAGIAVPTFVPGDAGEPDRLRMDSPRYVGRTSHDRPYAVMARSASLDPLSANVVYLDRPSADIALGEDGSVQLVAQNGTYDRAAGRLLLDGGIEVVTSNGYRFVTPSARVNLAQGRVRGRQPIEGFGPSGRLSADRFEIKDAGDVLRFDGRVRVTLLPPRQREARPAERAPRPDVGASS
ncbi:MAG TPA: LPS export ABC transporter periplasmic protein LptC [Geminicoccaceae bacterium]|nr:LPS export ABC transporter periplasmic protein LptC [Geminicoccaceae bacterium]